MTSKEVRMDVNGIVDVLDRENRWEITKKDALEFIRKKQRCLKKLFIALDLLEKKERNMLIELPFSIGSDVYVVMGGGIAYGKVTKENCMAILKAWKKTAFGTSEEADAKCEEEE